MALPFALIELVTLLQIRRPNAEQESLYCGTHVHVILPQHEYMTLSIIKIIS